MDQGVEAARSGGRLAATLAVWKLLFFAVVAAGVASFPTFFFSDAYWANFHGVPNTPPDRWTCLGTWEAQHHVCLAEDGYAPGRGSNEYFPLWPLVIRSAAWLFGGSHLAAGLVLANLLSIAAAVLYHRTASERFGAGAATTCLLFLLAFPGSLFLSFAYPESLFLLLAVVLMRSLSAGRWWLAALASFFLPLVRGFGVLAIVPLLHDRFVEWRSTGRLRPARLTGTLAPLAGLATYLAFMGAAAGDPLAGLKVTMKFLAQRSAGSLLDPPEFVRSLLGFGSLSGQVDSSLDRVWFLVAVVCLYRLRRRDRALFAYALPMVVVPALVSFMSYTRFLVMAFPVFMVMGEFFSDPRRRVARRVALAVCVVLQFYLTLRHVNFHWAG